MKGHQKKWHVVHSNKIQAITIVFFSILLYLPTIQFDFNLDDHHILDELPPKEAGFAGYIDIFNSDFGGADYRPIVVATFYTELLISGTINPKMSHFINALLYALACFLAFIFLKGLPLPNKKFIVFTTILFFVFHPIHANVVSSLKNRDILLSFSFVMLSLICLHPIINEALHFKKLRLVFWSGVCFLLGLLSKLDAAGLLILAPLTILLFNIKDFKKWGIALLIGAFYFGIFKLRMDVIGQSIIEFEDINPVSFTENPLIVYDSLLAKINAALASLFYYIKFLIYPKGYYLYFGYNTIDTAGFGIPQAIGAVIAILSIAIFIYGLKRNRALSFGILFFYATIFYCLNLYQLVNGIVAPRLAFIASLGFCMCLAIVVWNVKSRIKQPYLSLFPIGLLLLAYSFFTVDRTKDWKNLETLLEADMPHLTKSYQANRIAVETYLKWAMESKDKYTGLKFSKKAFICAKNGNAVFNKNVYMQEALGLSAFLSGKYTFAKATFINVIEKWPTTELSYEKLGDIYMIESKFDSAALYYKKQIDVIPDYFKAYFNYNIAMVQANRIDEAIAANMQYIERYPDYYFPYEGIGFLYFKKNEVFKAAPYIIKALQKGSPNKAYLKDFEAIYKEEGMLAEWKAITKNIQY